MSPRLNHYQDEVEMLRVQLEKERRTQRNLLEEVHALRRSHANEVDALKSQLEQEQHALRQEHAAKQEEERTTETLNEIYSAEFAALKSKLENTERSTESTNVQQLQAMQQTYAEELEALSLQLEGERDVNKQLEEAMRAMEIGRAEETEELRYIFPPFHLWRV